MRTLTARSAKLYDRLSAASAAVLRNMPEPELGDLQAQIRSLRTILGSSGKGAGVTIDKIRHEVAKFRATGHLSDVRSARLVCWGTMIGDKMHTPLIEDGERFAPFLHEVDGYRAMRRPYRRCWRGLLDGYVRYDPEGGAPSGKSNWRLLREYLNDNLPLLERSGQMPNWLQVVDEHANILTDNPCGRYGTTLLEDGDGELDALRRELSVGASSWIGRRIFDAQIEAAIGFDDSRFKAVLPRVLTVIARHDVLADRALARVLDRYTACVDHEIEPVLRDTAVTRWGNPWLGRNDTCWSLVRQETRGMISSWLKLRLMEDFFALLSEDGANDQRRINFWKQYVDQISDMHFALGKAAYTDPRPDFQRIRKSMKGLLLRLENSVARDNAFIMRIGDHIFVEFGEKGNAMFAFDARRLPFDLTKSNVSGDRSALKHSAHVARIVHSDRAGERWESKIEQLIAQLADRRVVSRSSDVAGVAVPISPRPAVDLGKARFPITPDRARKPANAVDLMDFLTSQRIRSADYRNKGGSFWVYAPKGGPISAELMLRGFAWSERRTAWYLKS